MLDLYTDPEWASGCDLGDLVPLAVNLLGLAPQRSEADGRSVRDEVLTHSDLSGSVRLTGPDECDAILVPIQHADHYRTEHGRRRFLEVCREAEKVSRSYGKGAVIHGEGLVEIVDPASQLDFPVTDYVYLNQALLRSRCTPRMEALPYFTEDVLEKYCEGRFEAVTPEQPTVGFCGFSPPLRQRWSRTRAFDVGRLLATHLHTVGVDAERVARRLGTNMKHAYRTRTILQFARHPRIQDDFIVRDEGALVSRTYFDEAHPDNTDFYDNMRRTLYNLGSRGTENYSIRLFETLCMGRIPVVVDTDLRLPFDRQIDYRQHCVVIDKADLRHGPDILLEFHHSRSTEQLRDLQEANRRLWEDYLSPAGFYEHLPSLLPAPT